MERDPINIELDQLRAEIDRLKAELDTWKRVAELQDSSRLKELAALRSGSSRCPLCEYQHGHAIGCQNNPVDIALRSGSEPVAWQERQARKGEVGNVTEWSDWYDCRPREATDPRTQVLAGIPYEWRPMFTHPQPKVEQEPVWWHHTDRGRDVFLTMTFGQPDETPLYTAPPADKRDAWQPIETAPKDGLSFLGVDIYGKMGVLWWNAKEQSLEDIQCLIDDDGVVTHWMPLPAAPIDAARSQE